MSAAKKGFDYCRLDNRIWYDEKIRKLKFNKKLSGYGIYIYLYVMTKCFDENGSYATADESFLFEIAEYFQISTGLVEDIICECVNVGLFCGKPLITNNPRKKAGQRISGHLTSVAIQERYVIMWQKAKRNPKFLEIPDDIRLISDEKIQELLKARDIEYVSNSEFGVSNSEDRVSNSEFDAQIPNLENKSKEKKKKEKEITINKLISFLRDKSALHENFLNSLENEPLRESILWWLGYKLERGEMFEKESRIRGELTRLRNESVGDPARALQIVENSIAHGWRGFDFKPTEDETPPPKNYQRRTQISNYQQENKNNERQF